MFVVGSAAQIPWEENFFDKVLSVESFYYIRSGTRAGRAVSRHGAAWAAVHLINLYKDNPYSLKWCRSLKVPVAGPFSGRSNVDLLKKHAFENVEYAQIPDDTPTPDGYQTTSFHSLDDMKAFKRIGRAAAEWHRAGCAESGAGVHDLLAAHFPFGTNGSCRCLNKQGVRT